MPVDTETIVTLGSAALALISAVLSGVMANRSARLAHQLERQKKEEDAAAEAERILQLYRDPLLDAAHTLQGRLFNIMAQGFLQKAYGDHVDEYERRYARDYTVFAIAEYLCWVEILRRELRFRDLGDVRRNQALLGHLNDIQYAFQRDDIPAQFRVFRGRQRAIAELMMVPTNATEGPRSECIGYAAFSRRLETDHEFRPWLLPLCEDVAVVAAATPYENQRLTLIQQQLIDLIDFLDPKKVRIPAHVRQRMADPAPGAAVPTQARVTP
jgi:hypothetical protein